MQVPFLSNRESAQPFKRIIKMTANEMQLSDYMVALIAAHLFEGIIREVSMGQPVTIPVLGIFCPVQWSSPTGKYPAHATPRFSPSRAFRNEVADCCTPCPVAEKVFVNYRKNHNRSGNPLSEVRRNNSRGFSGFRTFRQQIEAQAERLGLDPYETS